MKTKSVLVAQRLVTTKVLYRLGATFGNLSNAYVYLLVDTVMNIPRILALGLVVGYLYKKVYGQT
jgi:hypothetical protein